MPAFNKILDTFLFKNSEIFLKEFHVDRVFETYEFLNADVDHHEIVQIYESILKQLKSEYQSEKIVRVLLDPVRPHKHMVESKDLDKMVSPLTLVITDATHDVTAESQFKFEQRPLWDALLSARPAGTDDVLLVRDGQLIEASRFNLFLHDIKNGFIATPGLDSGCLNGVFRRYLLREGVLTLPEYGEVEVIEEDISIEDLEENQLYVGNSVRGIIPARII